MARSKKQFFREMQLIVVLLIAAGVFIVLSQATGEFIASVAPVESLTGTGTESVSNQPKYFASASDTVYIYLHPLSSNIPTATIVAPDGTHKMTIKHNSNLPYVARVKFDGTVDVRQPTSCTWSSGTGIVQVETDLVGAPLDGTWTITNAQNQLGLPSGMRLHIKGDSPSLKIFDDVATSSEDISVCGTGATPASSVPVKSWNWHMQSRQVYHSTLASIAVEENPINSKYFLPIPTSISTIHALGTTPGSSIGPLDFNEDVIPTDDDLLLESVNSIVQDPLTAGPYIGRTFLWLQMNPAEAIYLQQDKVMKAKSVEGLGSTVMIGSPLILNNDFLLTTSNPLKVTNMWAYTDYSASYEAYPKVGNQFGGFVLRWVDINNFIAIQPSTDSGIAIVKRRGGSDVTNAEIQRIINPPTTVPDGRFAIEASGNVYTLKTGGVILLQFRDTGSDFIPSPIGIYMLHSSIGPKEAIWDNFDVTVIS